LRVRSVSEARLAALLPQAAPARPDCANGVPYYPRTSLPSRRATVDSGALVAVFLLVSPRRRSTVALTGAIFSATLGVATFLDGCHRPADLVAAYLVVGISTLLGGFVIFRVSHRWNVIPARSRAEYVRIAE